MKFTPRALSGNVNVSERHPLAELAWLVGGLLTLLFIIYLVLWLVSELLAPRIPIGAELWAGRHLRQQVGCQPSPALQKRLDALLNRLPPNSPLYRYNFSVGVMENPEINALALPGGHIVVFSGLLQEIRSENELAMVLGHELGHYSRRDHLRGMGRGLGMTLLMMTLFGQDSRAAGITSQLFSGMEMRYSQNQEAAADAFGLQLLNARYGHVGGASELFSRLAERAGGRFSYLLASHPHPRDRIARLQRQATAAGYRLEKTVPLSGADLLTERAPPTQQPKKL